jgi:Uma2 family endonuclease
MQTVPPERYLSGVGPRPGLSQEVTRFSKLQVAVYRTAERVIESCEVAEMRVAPDLGIPETKPAIESIHGRWVHKVSPKRKHALLQIRLGALLLAWAGDRGEVGSEWRFYLLPRGDAPSSLVPDVAYVSFERLPPELGELREKPTIAPDIAVEVLSPDDRMNVFSEKIALYLTFGSRLVIVVDPHDRAVVLYERDGIRQFSADDVAISETYPDLRIELRSLFKGI